jgi:hypothetical protein
VLKLKLVYVHAWVIACQSVFLNGSVCLLNDTRLEVPPEVLFGCRLACPHPVCCCGRDVC